MRFVGTFSFALCLVHLVYAGSPHRSHKWWRNGWLNIQNTIAERNLTNNDWPNETNDWPPYPPFNCSKLSPQPNEPISVHALSPSDIDVVAAMGDSLTAANGAGATTIAGVLVNYRQMSFSIGGIEDVNSFITLANIIRYYNPNVYGYATGVGVADSYNAKLDVAVAGSVASDLPDQAVDLVNKLRTSKRVNFLEDWKLITVLIGGNDLCRVCKKPEKFSTDNYLRFIRETLDILHKEVPKAIVNVVQIFEITELSQLRGAVCDVVHYFICKCPTLTSPDVMAEVDAVNKNYQQGLTDLIASGRYDTRDDFTVVLQPFTEDTQLPLLPSGLPDKGYFAPDCFHFSSTGHQAAAVGLWNNMLEPVGVKKRQWVIGEPIECPNPSFPYFYTNRNSPVGYSQSMMSYVYLHNILVYTMMGLTICVLTIITVVVVSKVVLRQKRNAMKSDQINDLHSKDITGFKNPIYNYSKFY